MKYLALLRGINVGGNAPVNMAKLKEVCIKTGFTNVLTYINSGNVLFESKEHDSTRLTKEIEELLQKNFFAMKTVILSYEELQQVMKHTPNTWKTEDLRKYIAFIKPPSSPEDVIKEVQLKEDIDFIDPGPGVVYMSTKMNG